MTSGRVLVTQWAYYLHIAREERDETRRVMAADPQALPASSITSIVMSALAVEAFINELAEAADMAPRFTRVNGPLMARRLDRVEGRPSAFQAGHNPSRHKMYVRLVLSPVADACRWSLLLLSPLLSITVGGTDAHDGWHLGALVLVTTSGPFPGAVTSPCPAQTPPPNPIAAEPGDGRVLSRPPSRVHEPPTSPEAVALRPQTALTGSGSHRSSYGGFGGGHPHFHPHNGCENPISPKLALSAWELYGAVRLQPADSVTCANLNGLTVSDRDYPRGLLPSGTQRARAYFGEHLIRSKIKAVQDRPVLSGLAAGRPCGNRGIPARSGLIQSCC